MRQRLQQWLLMLNTREKVMVLGGGALAALILIWGFVWQPLLSEKENLEKQIQTRENELRWMQRAQAQIIQARSLPQQAPVKKVSNPSQVVETALQRYQLKKGLKQMRGNKQISISLQDVNVDQVFKFLGELETRYQLKIKAMEIVPLARDRQTSKGRVNADIKLASS